MTPEIGSVGVAIPVGSQDTNPQKFDRLCNVKYCPDIDKARLAERARIKKLINKMRELHIHPKQSPELFYYDRYEASGCRFCYINRKLKELLKAIEEETE